MNEFLEESENIVDVADQLDENPVDQQDVDDEVKVDEVGGEQAEKTPRQDQEVNKKYAQHRRENEAKEWKAKYEEASRQAEHISKIKTILSGFDGIEGDTLEEQMLSLEALQKGITVNEVLKQHEDEEQKFIKLKESILTSDPDVIALKEKASKLEEREREEVFKRDLSIIKEAYPDEKATSITELGEDFMELMATGRISSLSAYEVVRKEREKNAPPPTTGDIKSHNITAGMTKNRIESMNDSDFEKLLSKAKRGDLLNW